MENSIIYSTRSSNYLAEIIARKMNIPIGKIYRDEFGEGEKYRRLMIDSWHELRGKTAIIVGSTHTDEEFLEVCRLGYTLADLGTVRRIFIIPFFGYSTMERRVLSGEMVTAKIHAQMLSAIPNTGLGNQFFLLDLHVAGIAHYFEGNCSVEELYGGPTLVKFLRGTFLPKPKFASADLGRPAWVKYFAKAFNAGGIALVDKDREFTKTKVINVIGDVVGKDIAIYDDMSRSFGTLIGAVEAYKNVGATSVGAVLSHLAIYGDEIVQKIEHSPLEWVITTNSHPMTQLRSVQESKKIKVVDVSDVFVRVISPLV